MTAGSPATTGKMNDSNPSVKLVLAFRPSSDGHAGRVSREDTVELLKQEPDMME
jgi:hypothetical protein